MNAKTVIAVAVILVLGVFGYQHLEAGKLERLALLDMQKVEMVNRQGEENRQRQEQERRQQEEEQLRLAEEQRKQEEERQRQFAENKNRAYSFAETAKDKIIDSVYDGGTNCGVEVKDWDYYPDSDSFRVKVAMTWNGMFFASKSYGADGYLTVKADGSDLKWNPTWVSSTLSDYQESKRTIGAAVGTVVALGALGASGSAN